MEKEPLLTLYLIRHGETEVNRRNCVQGSRIDPPLNDRGKTQATFVGQRFKDVAVDQIVTSNARRAKETGAAISSHHPSAPFTHMAALNELSFGDYEGTHVTAGYNDLVHKWDVEKMSELKAPGEHGESPADCERRAIPCLRNIVAKALADGQRNVCVVVHSRLIQIVLASMLDGSLATMGVYKQKKAAVNVVDVLGPADSTMWPYRCVARDINSVSHMPEDVISHVSSATSLFNRNLSDEQIRFELDADGTLVLKQL
ncbi:hypothetical protein LPJ73_000697 [Coemansia sp. RSA 2703]|nr:hypothetical protein LPJ73_000697 [Coemansia sp. RSA 2703]KAJ2377230.1 hypothetical protein IW150_001508 [Coemansia sp. RSA 2607]KAJ2397791.1 hypothetical protein GGI05_000453 [Coemansia sp. RSA 2603]